MSGDRLTPLQRRILRVLAALTPPWTLTGGAALAGFHLGHRSTRDLDLFWRSRPELGGSLSDALAAVRADGLDAQILRTSPAFAELRVADGKDVCLVDLVAETTGPLEPPQQVELDGTIVAVDSRHEILVAKLTALLGRSELRDLVDVRALLNAGGDLGAALLDAPSKDAGFSPLTLAWVLKGLDPRPAARVLGWNAAETDEIDSFRRWLLDRIAACAAPE